MKNTVLLTFSLLAIAWTGCKKDAAQVEAISFSKPSGSSITAAAGAVITLQAQLTVNDKIEKLEVFQKIGANTQIQITSKGFSNSTSTDTYIDTYTVPAGTALGSVITLTFILYQKGMSTEFARKTITITVN